MILISLGILVLFFITVFIAAYLLGESTRPKGKVKSFRTRFTPNVWTSEQHEYALNVFYDTWLRYYPNRKRKVRSILNSLNLEWSDKRWKKNGQVAAAELKSPTHLKIWRGPRLINNQYKMSYTTLPESLIQVLVYRLEEKILDNKSINTDFKDFLLDIRRQLKAQVSNATFSPTFKRDRGN
jgi:hypothetical protein